MKLFITFAVVRFLEYGHVIDAAFVQVLVLVDIHWVDFDANELEVFTCKFACFADVFDAAFRTAFTGEQEDFFHAAIGNDFHLVLDLFHVQLHALDMVVAVEPTIDAVVFAVVRDIERREQINVVAKVTTCFNFRLGSHFFEERGSGRRKQSLEIFNRTCIVLQSEFHVTCGVLGSVVTIKCGENLVANV